MTERMPEPLPVAAVRFRVDPATLGIASSDELTAADAIVGQGTALEALGTGLDMAAPGFNIYLAGSKGTGRFAAVRQMIGMCNLECEAALSQSYLYDFAHPDRALLITLPPGMGREFQSAVDDLRASLGEEIPALLGSEVMSKSRQRLLDKFERESKRLFSSFEERMDEAGFAIAQSQTATGTIRMADIFPIIDGEPVAMEQLEADPMDAGLDEVKLTDMQAQHRSFKSELGSLVSMHRDLGDRYRGLVRDSEQRKVGDALDPLFVQLLERFQKHDENIVGWVDGLKAELMQNLELFRPTPPEQAPAPGPTMEGFLWFVRSNLLWDPAEEDEKNPSPVVEENWPTWRNLFGTIEAAGDPPIPSFMDIKPGSLLRANGGFLVLYANETLRERGVYENLKRILRKGELEIGPQQESSHAPFALKPAPIPIKVKVVLVGERHSYDMLHVMDPDFASLFKVKVEFEDDMPRTDDNVGAFLAVLKRIIGRESLATFEAGALASLLEEGVRVTGHRDHLTTRFSELADLMREANHVTKDRGGERVTKEDQDAAIRRRLARHDLVERKMLEMIEDGKVLLQVEGTRVGQINGLGYYDLDDAQFGMPARISATCAIGRRGIVNIEREADLSGRIHDKGVLILSGFLASTFAQDKPLSLHANVAFEQSYAMVDGDSASLAELLALLSALSGLPLRQDIAVTGSLNQHGQVQPVGGVTEKVQGFFRACQFKGLTGTQGVMLPASNISDLHLDGAVCEAIAAGQFHVWPATDTRGALALMTERPADEALLACDAKLKRYAETVRDYLR
ncbi:MAG: AAA family ATPase [Planctomycetes bacterium]|nr:AAA family ATPase [Planctomycetota bacterium]